MPEADLKLPKRLDESPGGIAFPLSSPQSPPMILVGWRILGLSGNQRAAAALVFEIVSAPPV
jgi:hypothetical protein